MKAPLNDRYISFNPFRSIGMPGIKHIKAEKMFLHIDDIKQAHCLLFPEYWQVNTLVYALKKKIFPSIASYHLGHDKIEMTRSFTALCPAHVPLTKIMSNTSADFDVLAGEFGLPFVCKETRNSSGLGVFLIHSRDDFNRFIRDNPVVYVQEYLDIDRDLRIIVIGDQVISAYWRIGADGCFHNNIARGGHIDTDNIPSDILENIADLAVQTGINYAGFDVAVTSYGYYILEFNLLFGMRGLHQDSQCMAKKIHDYLQNDNCIPMEIF